MSFVCCWRRPQADPALTDDDHFVGLGIDEDRQPELTAERVETWVKQLHSETQRLVRGQLTVSLSLYLLWQRVN